MLRLRGERIEVYIFSDGRVRADAGSMYGVVPRKLWLKYTVPDEDNMVELSLNCMLVHHIYENHWVLVDTGLGEALPERYVKVLGCRRLENEGLSRALKVLGISREDIKYIVVTHLHYDHAGGILEWSTGKLLFPNALILVQSKELDAAFNPNPRTRPSYFPELIEALRRAEIRVFDGDSKPFEYLQLVFTGGHTYGHQVIILSDPCFKLAFPGDLFPMPAHFNPLWVPAFDVRPDDTVIAKLNLLDRFYKEDMLVVLDHTVDCFLGKVIKDERDRYKYRPISIEELREMGISAVVID